MRMISERLAAYAVTAGLAATPVPALAVTDTVAIPPGACAKDAPAELCPTSLLVDLTGVTKYRFSVRASGYDTGDSANKMVFLAYQNINTGTWSDCLGSLPCRGISVLNIPPDAFGNDQKLYWSPLINVPASQRGQTLLRLQTASGATGAPVVTQTSVVLYFP